MQVHYEQSVSQVKQAITSHSSIYSNWNKTEETDAFAAMGFQRFCKPASPITQGNQTSNKRMDTEGVIILLQIPIRVYVVTTRDQLDHKRTELVQRSAPRSPPCPSEHVSVQGRMAVTLGPEKSCTDESNTEQQKTILAEIQPDHNCNGQRVNLVQENILMKNYGGSLAHTFLYSLRRIRTNKYSMAPYLYKKKQVSFFLNTSK